MKKDEVKALAYLMFEKLGQVKKIKLGRIGKLDPIAIKDAYRLVFDSVKEVEQFSVNYGKLSSDDKLNVVIEILDELIDIPWCPAFLERLIFTWFINLVVYIFNRIGGKDWLDSLFSNKKG